jgi:hypothetical protein
MYKSLEPNILKSQHAQFGLVCMKVTEWENHIIQGHSLLK